MLKWKVVKTALWFGKDCNAIICLFWWQVKAWFDSKLVRTVSSQSRAAPALFCVGGYSQSLLTLFVLRCGQPCLRKAGTSLRLFLIYTVVLARSSWSSEAVGATGRHRRAPALRARSPGAGKVGDMGNNGGRSRLKGVCVLCRVSGHHLFQREVLESHWYSHISGGRVFFCSL